MTSPEVALWSSALLLFPLAVFSLLNGSMTPPKFGPLKRYFEAEPLLRPVGDILLIALSLIAAGKLALHFGLIAQEHAQAVENASNWIFLPVLLVDLGFWVRAHLKVRRMGAM